MRQMAGSLRIHGKGAISVWSNGAMPLPAASTGGTGKAGIAPHVDDDRHTASAPRRASRASGELSAYRRPCANLLDTSSVAQCLDRGLKGRLLFPCGFIS
jgi:hypothetical protein